MRLCTLFACAALVSRVAHAQGAKPPKPDSAAKIGNVTVTAERDKKPAITQLTLPVTASVTAQRARETVNVMDAEDVVKYLPTIYLRKRNSGDTQSIMATRTWGVSSSARSLIFADGVPLTALIANNNTIGGPRWGLVAPEDIERVDLMYGPFSAAYGGNSMGAVMEITTRRPEKLEGSVTQTQALQSFDLYGTSNKFSTAQTSARVADRIGKWSLGASGNYQNSWSQPLAYVTSGTFPSGTTGGFAESNKLGAAANVLGASGLLHTRMTNATLKAAYDFTPAVRAAYTFGYWKNDADGGVAPFIARSDTATFAGQSGFASGTSRVLAHHSAHSISLRTDTRRDWDFELVGTKYAFDQDRSNTPTSASANGTTLGSAGRVASLDGTGWTTVDLKAAWHRGGRSAAHIISAGVHDDRYVLRNPTYSTPDWTTGDSLGTVASEGDGKTSTFAVWAQDRWRLSSSLTLTAGGRYEHWRGYDGFNANGSTRVTQTDVDASRFSPKAMLAFAPSGDWSVTASVGKAYRFATASELYQLVTTGTTFTSPDPNLKPDNVLAMELRAERRFTRGRVQVAVFEDDVHDAIISQFKPLVAGSSTLYSFASNVDHVRSRGIELVLGANDALVSGLELTGSATYVDARTLALSGQASAMAAPSAAIGKQLPNIPKRRANFAATYRPDARWALTLGGRYSDKMFTTLDNADVHPNTYQGFAAWFVADARAHFRVNDRWTVGAGVDNLLDRKYFLFHPFPQRTFSANLRVGF